jgi:hypothetical protein
LRRAVEGVKDRIGGYRTTILDRHLFDVISPHDLLVRRENDEMYARLGEGSVGSAFKIARQQDPTATLVLSDDKALVAVGTEHLEELLRHRAGAAGVSPGGASAWLTPGESGKALRTAAPATSCNSADALQRASPSA